MSQKEAPKAMEATLRIRTRTQQIQQNEHGSALEGEDEAKVLSDDGLDLLDVELEEENDNGEDPTDLHERKKTYTCNKWKGKDQINR